MPTYWDGPTGIEDHATIAIMHLRSHMLQK